MSRDAQASDTLDGGIHRHRPDGIFASVSIRALDNPEPSGGISGPPISNIRRLSFVVNDEGDGHGDDDDQYEPRGQLVHEIVAREATVPAGGIQHPTTRTAATTHGRDGLVTTPRRWPTRAVTDDNIDNCYVDFILCCNPAVPDACDAAELRRSFRAPPKSGGTMFSIFRLFQLIKRFEEGSIKTWIQLVTELGVERKEDQSTQKVQQYAVRLKRWMHAMHIDAFFEYCLNRPHVYYDEIPPNLPGLDDELRDGVPLEEDLALRALMPEYRPKRGRRKTERASIDSSYSSDIAIEKRPRQLLLPATLPSLLSPDSSGLLQYEDSHIPFPRDDRIREMDNSRLWSDIRMPNPQPLFPSIYTNPFDTLHPVLPAGHQLRWRSSQRPSDPSGESAAGSPQRARSRSEQRLLGVKRARRSHGPAVSSAWPSSGTSRGGRPRGRPTGNRGAAETAYSTFTASPRSLEVQLDDQDIAIALEPGLAPAPVTMEEQLHFPPEAHQTILPPIIHPLEELPYDHDVEIPPLLERDDLRGVLRHPPLNPYGGIQRVDDIKGELATRLSLLTASRDDININLATALAFSLVDKMVETGCERLNSESSLRSVCLLLGLDGFDMQDLVIKKHIGQTSNGLESDVQQLQKEMGLFERYRGDDSEEQSIHDLINAAGAVTSPHTMEVTTDHEAMELRETATDDRYDISWKVKFGPIEASLSASATPTWGTNRPQASQASQDEQRLRDEVDMLLSDMETGNPSPGSFPGSTSDLLFNDELDPPSEGLVYWRSKYFETKARLDKAEKDLEKLKHDLIARVMS